MIGKRFYKLLQELNASQSKKLLHQNKGSNDKRLKILSKLVKKRNYSYNELIDYLYQEAKVTMKDCSESEFEHFLRRLTDFYCKVIENIIILDSTDENLSQRNSILAEYFIQTANPDLIDYYLNKSYDIALSRKEYPSALNILSKLVPFHFSKYTERDFILGLKLNELNKEISENYHFIKLVEYYNNITNLFIENNTLIHKSAEELINEIEDTISTFNDASYIIDLRISQMRLCFGTKQFDKYSNKIEDLIHKLPKEGTEELVLKKKFHYMKLIYGFFTGKSITELQKTVDVIIDINNQTGHIDSTAMWYKIILLIMNDQLSEARKLLSRSKYFKLDYSYLKDFLEGLIYFVEGETKKSIRILNSLLDSKNYFIGHFSRILLISIHFKKENEELSHSLIQSGLKLIKKHPEKFVINPSSLYVLNHFKEIYSGYSKPNEKHPLNICLFHQFVLKY